LPDLTLVFGIIYVAVAALALVYLEAERAKQDPIAGVKTRDYVKDSGSPQVIDFKAAPRSFVFLSTSPVLSKIMISFFFGGVPLVMFIFTMLFPGTGYEPGWEIKGPLLVTLMPLSFTLFAFMYVTPELHKMRGALSYRLTNRALIVRNTLGSTVIPYSMIKAVRNDSLYVREYIEQGRRNLVYSYADLAGTEVTLFRDSWLPQYRGAPYVSRDSGECVFVDLKGCDTHIVLTPENMELSRELSQRISTAS